MNHSNVTTLAQVVAVVSLVMFPPSGCVAEVEPATSVGTYSSGDAGDDCQSQELRAACDNVQALDACKSGSPWEGACIDGWCHCYADAHCVAYGGACTAGVCTTAASCQGSDGGCLLGCY